MPDEERPDATQSIGESTVRDLIVELKARSFAMVLVATIPTEDGNDGRSDSVFAWCGNDFHAYGLAAFGLAKMDDVLMDDSDGGEFRT